MRSIRLLDESAVDELLRIMRNAYPGVPFAPLDTHREQTLEEIRDNATVELFGVFEGERMVACFRIHDFTMNCLGTPIPVGGIGGIAVDLAHKKERIAHDIMGWYLCHYHERETALLALYPFRLSFYRRMGFGYGTPMHRFLLRPESFPRGERSHGARFLHETDREETIACYERVMERTHGMFRKTPRERRQLTTAEERSVIGVQEGERLRGYLSFSFKERGSRHFLRHDLVIREWIHESTDALRRLAGFLSVQADQVDRIVLHTQDDLLQHILSDPVNDSGRMFLINHEISTRGLGILYRVIDVPRIFHQLRDHDFGGCSLKLKITLDDAFFPRNQGSTTLRFEEGKPVALDREGDADVEIALDVGDFSSLLLGVIPFRKLHGYGLARISDPAQVGLIERLFAATEKPVCTTAF